MLGTRVRTSLSLFLSLSMSLSLSLFLHCFSSISICSQQRMHKVQKGHTIIITSYQGRPSPYEAMMHFPPVSDFPVF